MAKKNRTIIGVAIIIVFGGLGIWSLVDTATPYVSFKQARTIQSRVQVLGIVERHSGVYDENTGIFSFYMKDESGDRIKVEFNGIKPGNFEQATSVVCIGQVRRGIFLASDLLVKCPSKYQGPETQDDIGRQGKGF